MDTDGAQSQMPSRLIPYFYILPIILLLSSSVILLAIDERFRYLSGGNESEYTDITTRFGMSGGVTPFLLMILVGSILWLFGFSFWINSIVKDRKPHWTNAILLLAGFISHIWILGRIFDFIMKHI